MAAHAEIFFEHDRWGRNLAWSVILHVGVAAAIIFYAVVFPSGPGGSWGGGGGGDAIGATLVTTVPLPANPVQTQNVLANESKGLAESKPKPEEAQLPDAIPIPEKEVKVKKKPKPEISASQRKPEPQPPQEATNVIPFGQGGPVSGPYGVFSAGGAKGGLSFGGGGDFGNRYAWYVRVVQQKVSQNWLKYEVDPSITSAQRVYLTFDITRDGQPTNVQIEQSSGVPSLDQSAVRAIERIDTFGPLPSDYAGNKVSVEFWFDYKR
jgi:periplasmic protein TonB